MITAGSGDSETECTVLGAGGLPITLGAICLALTVASVMRRRIV